MGGKIDFRAEALRGIVRSLDEPCSRRLDACPDLLDKRSHCLSRGLKLSIHCLDAPCSTALDMRSDLGDDVGHCSHGAAHLVARLTYPIRERITACVHSATYAV